MIEWITEVGVAFWEMLLEMSPYLVMGFALAGVLSVLIPAELVEKHLGGRGWGPIAKASLFGVPLPLCSCSVIPVAASLRKHGSSKGATAAFLLSTPQTGVDSIMATFSLLGPVFAIFRPIAAFLTGLIGGAIIQTVDGRTGPTPDADREVCQDACCDEHATHRRRWAGAFRHGFIVLPRDIGRALLIGLLIAGVISVVVPDDFFSQTLGTGFLAMLVMMLLGIPIYVCATASIPVAAAMMMKGASPGAALVFLMTGPTTNAAAIATLWTMLGHRSAIAYLLVVAGSALLCGVTLDALFSAMQLQPNEAMPPMLPSWVNLSMAICLLVILVPAVLPRRKKEGHAG